MYFISCVQLNNVNYNVVEEVHVTTPEVNLVLLTVFIDAIADVEERYLCNLTCPVGINNVE
jgi:hypothetical protein